MATSYRIGIAGPGSQTRRGQRLRHATEHGRVALCGVAVRLGAEGQWSRDHPRACPKCQRVIARTGAGAP